MRKDKIFQGLKSALQVQRLPHALIFAGETNVGKLELAQKLASELFAGVVESSRHLEKIKKSIHPDLQLIQAEAKFIKVDAIRLLIPWLSYAALESNSKVVIIDGADKMNSSAANALLKVLEEPPQNTFFILTCENQKQLPKTIRSRCQLFYLSPEKQSDFLSELQILFPEQDLALVSALANGSRERARELILDEDELHFVEDCRKVMLEYWSSETASSTGARNFIEKVKEQRQFEIVLKCWTLLLRDLNLVANFQDNPEFIDSKADFQKDIGDQLRKIAESGINKLGQKNFIQSISSKMQFLESAAQSFAFNVSLKIVLTKLLLSLSLYSEPNRG